MNTPDHSPPAAPECARLGQRRDDMPLAGLGSLMLRSARPSAQTRTNAKGYRPGELARRSPQDHPGSLLTSEQSERAETNIVLVRVIARRIARTIGTQMMSLEELESVGNEALVRTAMRYDPHLCASFVRFARHRVRGAMIDALRKRTPGRHKQKRAMARLATAQELLGQVAEDRPAREYAGERHQLERQVQTAQQWVHRASVAVCLSEPDTRISFERIATHELSPEQALIAADQRHLLRVLLDDLEPQERALIDAIYMQGREMQDFAREIGTSSATISRRHARIIERLRKRALAVERGSVRSNRETA